MKRTIKREARAGGAVDIRQRPDLGRRWRNSRCRPRRAEWLLGEDGVASANAGLSPNRFQRLHSTGRVLPTMNLSHVKDISRTVHIMSTALENAIHSIAFPNAYWEWFV